MSSDHQDSAGDGLLRLVALDAEDLTVLSAHVQDAVLKVGDMVWLRREQCFVLPMNRFAWETDPTGPPWRRTFERRRSALHFDRVTAVRSSGFDRRSKDMVLELLAIRFDPQEGPSGDAVIDFAGGATLRLSVECLEAQLADLGPIWATERAPDHGPA